MSQCPFQSRLSAFHDRELDATLATKIESHLSDCQECQQALQGIRAVSRLLSPAGGGRMSQMGVARLHAVADAAARRREVFPLARALLAVAASVLVIAGLGSANAVADPGWQRDRRSEAGSRLGEIGPRRES